MLEIREQIKVKMDIFSNEIVSQRINKHEIKAILHSKGLLPACNFDRLGMLNLSILTN